jgi:alpha-D-ribose 1-methylphosphonate 5-triphosphate synthase subunit PhnG
MVQGRAGGTGRPFNLGDMTVTRCNVRMADGTVGAAYVAGRCHRHAELAAVIDAVLQTTESDCPLRDAIESLSREQQERRAQQGRKAAATKVEFFTMVRGED